MTEKGLKHKVHRPYTLYVSLILPSIFDRTAYGFRHGRLRALARLHGSNGHFHVSLRDLCLILWGIVNRTDIANCQALVQQKHMRRPCGSKFGIHFLSIVKKVGEVKTLFPGIFSNESSGCTVGSLGLIAMTG